MAALAGAPPRTFNCTAKFSFARLGRPDSPRSTERRGKHHVDVLTEELPFDRTDDAFYHSQGFAHVMHHLTQAVRREYEAELRDRGTVLDLFEQIEASLGRAAAMKPLIILDGRPDGLFANHRSNLVASIVDARQLMYSVREELEK
jgi:hypothetical protein